jgi:hypothetical protein
MEWEEEEEEEKEDSHGGMEWENDLGLKTEGGLVRCLELIRDLLVDRCIQCI